MDTNKPQNLAKVPTIRLVNKLSFIVAHLRQLAKEGAAHA